MKVTTCVFVAVCMVGMLALSVSGKTYFLEKFDGDWQSRWVDSSWKKSDGQHGTFDVSAGDWYNDESEDAGLRTSEDARFYAISAKFDEAFSNKDKDLVVQFSVKHAQKIDCGGGYLKLLPADVDQANFGGDSKYFVMFGPDICGTSTKRVHAIFEHEGENLLTTKETKCETDQLTHVYTFIVRPDDTYELRIDGEEKASGSVFDDWEFTAPKKIKDPDAKKPDDWVDSPKMDDPEDVKPEDYDDIPATIPDPDAAKPDDWDDEADGDWEAPTVPNPEYKGAWKPKQIDNPDYKGPWVHPEIDNPDYVEKTGVVHFDNIGAIGIDIWQVKSGTIFDNILVTDSVEEAEALVDEWKAGKDAEKAMFDTVQEAERKKADDERKKIEEEREKQEEEDAEDDEEDEDDEEEDDDEEDDEEDDEHDEL